MSQPWHTHPALAGRFHPDHPDDVQVIVHDGGPRLTDRRPEAVWVRVLAQDADVFTGEVLNRPQQLRTVNQGDHVRFIVPASGQHPLMVRPNYLRERANWKIHPCNQCGLSELLDAPTDLIPRIFPNMPPDAAPVMFTSFCGLCGGVQGVEAIDAASEGDAEGDVGNESSHHGRPSRPRKRWWQFWR
jgi:hypothetical protein